MSGCPNCDVYREHIRSLEKREREAAARWRYHHELTLTALRMLHRAGKLTPKTDDERALLKAFHESFTLAPNRRLGPVRVGDNMTRDEYVSHTATELCAFLDDEYGKR